MFQMIGAMLTKRLAEAILSHLSDKALITVLTNERLKRRPEDIPKGHVPVIVQTTGRQGPIDQDPHHFQSAVTMTSFRNERVVQTGPKEFLVKIQGQVLSDLNTMLGGGVIEIDI